MKLDPGASRSKDCWKNGIILSSFRIFASTSSGAYDLYRILVLAKPPRLG
ncbi:MAG: hypothetical protein WAL42_09210 [Nitrososphaeraceae archaeon]